MPSKKELLKRVKALQEDHVRRDEAEMASEVSLPLRRSLCERIRTATECRGGTCTSALFFRTTDEYHGRKCERAALLRELGGPEEVQRQVNAAHLAAIEGANYSLGYAGNVGTNSPLIINPRDYEALQRAASDLGQGLDAVQDRVDAARYAGLRLPIQGLDSAGPRPEEAAERSSPASLEGSEPGPIRPTPPLPDNT